MTVLQLFVRPLAGSLYADPRFMMRVHEALERASDYRAKCRLASSNHLPCLKNEVYEVRIEDAQDSRMVNLVKGILKGRMGSSCIERVNKYATLKDLQSGVSPVAILVNGDNAPSTESSRL